MFVQQNRPWLNFYPETANLSFEIPEVNLYSLLEQTEKKYSSRIALIYDSEKMTYRELKSQVDLLAGAWHHLGAEKGERLGLMVSNHPAFVICYYAALKLGMMVVQINPMYTERELLEIFQDAEVSYLVTESINLSQITYPLKQIFTTEKAKEVYKYPRMYKHGRTYR